MSLLKLNDSCLRHDAHNDYDTFGAASAMVETAEQLTRDDDAVMVPPSTDCCTVLLLHLLAVQPLQ